MTTYHNWIEARSASQGILFALLIMSATFAQDSAPAAAPQHPSHTDLSYYLAADGAKTPIKSAEDWGKRRAQILAGMQEVMGPFSHPKSNAPLNVKVIEEHNEGGYIRRKIVFDSVAPNSLIHAWLLLPTAQSSTKRPAVLCLHQTGPHGKDSVVGLTDRPQMHYAKELTRRGYITISPDYPSFGENKDYNFETDDYVSGTMKAIRDNTRAIDLLKSLPEVETNHIGCIGHSLGGHNALFTAAFDPRIKAVVTSCGFTTFHHYYGGNLQGWTQTRYMPLIKTKFHGSPDVMPFDFPEVIAAIAPRAVFINAPLHDDNFDIDGVRETIAAASPIFKLLGVPNNLQAAHPDSAHEFPDAERAAAYSFLDKHLRP